MSQSSKSSVTLGAVWRTLTLAGEEPRSRRSLHSLQVSSNQLSLSQIFQTFFHQKKINVSIGWPLTDWHVKLKTKWPRDLFHGHLWALEAF